jgi:hypothetical protein
MTRTFYAQVGTVNISATSLSSNQYMYTENCPATMPAGTNCTFTITFQPTSAGTHNGDIYVYDNAPDTPQSYQLYGTGIYPLSPTPTSLAFPTTAVGQSSVLTLTLTNVSTSTITGISATLSSSFFTQTNNCPGSLTVGAACTVTATFTPKDTKKHSANLYVYNSGAGSPVNVLLTGTGK